MPSQYVVDRFEGDVAVLTPKGGGAARDVPRAQLPPEARPGATLTEAAGGSWRVDEQDSFERAERIRGKMARLFSH